MRVRAKAVQTGKNAIQDRVYGKILRAGAIVQAAGEGSGGVFIPGSQARVWKRDLKGITAAMIILRTFPIYRLQRYETLHAVQGDR